MKNYCVRVLFLDYDKGGNLKVNAHKFSALIMAVQTKSEYWFDFMRKTRYHMMGHFPNNWHLAAETCFTRGNINDHYTTLSGKADHFINLTMSSISFVLFFDTKRDYGFGNL